MLDELSSGSLKDSLDQLIRVYLVDQLLIDRTGLEKSPALLLRNWFLPKVGWAEHVSWCKIRFL